MIFKVVFVKCNATQTKAKKTPKQNFLIYPATASTHNGCTLRQGIIVKDSPPASIKVFLPLIAISSKVSRQSLTKEGHTTNNLFIPSPGNSFNLISVNGVSHPFPRRD